LRERLLAKDDVPQRSLARDGFANLRAGFAGPSDLHAVGGDDRATLSQRRGLYSSTPGLSSGFCRLRALAHGKPGLELQSAPLGGQVILGGQILAELVAHAAVNVFTNYFNRVNVTPIDFPHVRPLPKAA
jgi:hypothetical protein